MKAWAWKSICSAALGFVAACGGAEFSAHELDEHEDAGADVVHTEDAGILRDSGDVGDVDDGGPGVGHDGGAGDAGDDAEGDGGDVEPNPYGDRVCGGPCEGRIPAQQGASCGPSEGCCDCAPGLRCTWAGDTQHKCQPEPAAPCVGTGPVNFPCDSECQCLPGLVCAWRDNPHLGGSYICITDPR